MRFISKIWPHCINVCPSFTIGSMTNKVVAIFFSNMPHHQISHNKSPKHAFQSKNDRIEGQNFYSFAWLTYTLVVSWSTFKASHQLCIHPLKQNTTICTCMDYLYLSLTLCVNTFARYIFASKQLSDRNKYLCKRDNNSSTNLSFTPWTTQTFMSNMVITSFVGHVLRYNNWHASATTCSHYYKNGVQFTSL